MGYSNIVAEFNALRLNTLATLDEIAAKAAAFELPPPPTPFADSKNKLNQNEYEVLVAGEAKRGKSSLVNALIGRDLLPTDVDIATSQVFRIRQSDEEAYRVRFEDGSAKRISATDLPLYGAQAFAEPGAAPDAARVIRWIEVDVPVRFLPPGISILDTPGVGGLYTSHAVLTRRFIAEADAVIFVLDSLQPVLADELDFVREIVDVTHDILFVQTKIDMVSRDEWTELQRRNVEILARAFSESLADIRVWPLSSANLRRAADSDHPEPFLKVSRQRELSAALESFLVRVSGWRRTAGALLTAGEYITSGKRVLNERTATLAEQSRQRAIEIQNDIEKRREAFERDWGENGGKRRELTRAIESVIAAADREMDAALEPHSPLMASLDARIDRITSLAEANEYSRKVPGELAARAAQIRDRIFASAAAKCGDLVSPLVKQASAVTALVPGRAIESGSELVLELKDDLFARVKGSAKEFKLAQSLGTAVVFLTHSFTAGVAVVAWVLYRGWRHSKQEQLDAAKKEVRSHLFTALENLKGAMVEPESLAGQPRSPQYFGDLERTILERNDGLFQHRAEELRKEVARRDRQRQLDDGERSKQLELIRSQSNEWNEIEAKWAAATRRLKALDNELAATAMLGS